MRGFINEAVDHLSADASSLEKTAYKELGKKKRVSSRSALQPADVGTVESNDANLRQLLLLSEAHALSGSVQFQFPKDVLHAGEIQSGAKVEILSASWAKRGAHSL